MYSISVIVPCYNAQAHLQACLTSLRVQKIDDAQFILIDDGSTDATAAMLDEFAKDEPRAQVLHTQNGGVSAARNRGIARAQGRYIAFLDADDVYAEKGLAHLYAKAVESGADITSANHTVLIEESRTRLRVASEDSAPTPQEVVRKIVRMDRIYNNLWNKLYKRSLFADGTMRLDEGIRIGEDAALNLQLFQKAKVLAHLQEDTYVYRVHENSAMADLPGGYARAHMPMLRSMARTLALAGKKEEYFVDFLYSAMWILEKHQGVKGAAGQFYEILFPLIKADIAFGALSFKGKMLYTGMVLHVFPLYYIARHMYRKIRGKHANEQ